MAKLGFKSFNAIVDSHFDKIPNEYFRGERLVPKSLETESHRQARKERERAKQQSSRSGKRRSASAGVVGAGAAAADDDSDDSGRSRSRSRHRSSARSRRPRYRSDSDESPQRRRGEQRSPDYTQQPRGNYPPGPPPEASYAQGDPNFAVNHGNYQQAPDQGQQGFNPPYDPYAVGSSVTSPSQDHQNQQLQTRAFSPQMGEQYYAPPPPGGGYQRYDPNNYRPQGSIQATSSQAVDDRYPPARYSQSSQGGQNGGTGGAHNDRYSDSHSGHSDDRDRRGRDKDKDRSRRHRKSRSRSSSAGGNPMKKQMQKHLDVSEQGLTAGALGALAGGLVGNKLFKGPISTVAGVVIGGLGANAWEARDSRHKSQAASPSSRKKESSSSQQRTRSEGHRSSRDERGSHDKNMYSSEEEDAPRDRKSSYRDQGSDNDSSEEEYQRRKQRRKSKAARDAIPGVDDDPAMKWGTSMKNPAY